MAGNEGHATDTPFHYQVFYCANIMFQPPYAANCLLNISFSMQITFRCVAMNLSTSDVFYKISGTKNKLRSYKGIVAVNSQMARHLAP